MDWLRGGWRERGAWLTKVWLRHLEISMWDIVLSLWKIINLSSVLDILIKQTSFFVLFFNSVLVFFLHCILFLVFQNKPSLTSHVLQSEPLSPHTHNQHWTLKNVNWLWVLHSVLSLHQTTMRIEEWEKLKGILSSFLMLQFFCMLTASGLTLIQY